MKTMILSAFIAALFSLSAFAHEGAKSNQELKPRTVTLREFR